MKKKKGFTELVLLIERGKAEAASNDEVTYSASML